MPDHDTPLAGRRVAFLVANEGIEEPELTEPWEAVTRAGGRAELLAPDSGEVQCFRHLERSVTRLVDRTVGDASPDDYDALVLPGGVANADQLRTDPQAVHFVRRMFEADKPAAVICHGPWILADAGVLDGRTLTSWPSLRTDLHNAGAEWVDEEVRIDGRAVNPIPFMKSTDYVLAMQKRAGAASMDAIGGPSGGSH